MVAVMGDGGFLFMVEELAMAAHYNLPIIVLVLNNGFLSLIRQNQKYAYGYQHAVDIRYGEGLPDLVAIAKGFGCLGERVERWEDLQPAFARAKEARRPYVIDIIVEREADCSMGAASTASESSRKEMGYGSEEKARRCHPVGRESLEFARYPGRGGGGNVPDPDQSTAGGPHQHRPPPRNDGHVLRIRGAEPGDG